MTEQARKIKHEAIPQWAEGLYYNKGFFSEVLVYHDDQALYFECKGKDSGIVRFSFEILDTLKTVIEEEQEDSGEAVGEVGEGAGQAAQPYRIHPLIQRKLPRTPLPLSS
jgi:hypothetical protein